MESFCLQEEDSITVSLTDTLASEPKDGVFDVLIIGSGPSGLTAAIYTTRGALSTLVLAGSKWGGQLQLTTDVENFPGFPQGIQGPELMQKMREQAERFGAKINDVDVESVDFSGGEIGGIRVFRVMGDGKTHMAKAVIIATGADTKWLGLESEQRLIGRGVSSCAPCDAPFFKDKRVVVVGGGDSAMEEALVLTKYATSVTIIHRRNEFRASDIMQKKVFDNPKIKIQWNTEVVEILGEERVVGIKIKGTQSGEEKGMEVDGVFVAIGHTPSTNIFKGKIELDEKGYVKKNQKLKIEMQNGEEGNFQTATSVPGIFVAGDVHDYHYRQAITAAGYGCQAAMDLEKWLGVDPATR